jgi:hypothetical protein
MTKQIYDPVAKQLVVTTLVPTPTAPKQKVDNYAVNQLAGSWVITNGDSGSEVARFDKFGDALAEAARRNAIEQARGLT